MGPKIVMTYFFLLEVDFEYLLRWPWLDDMLVNPWTFKVEILSPHENNTFSISHDPSPFSLKPSTKVHHLVFGGHLTTCSPPPSSSFSSPKFPKVQETRDPNFLWLGFPLLVLVFASSSMSLMRFYLTWLQPWGPLEPPSCHPSYPKWD